MVLHPRGRLAVFASFSALALSTVLSSPAQGEALATPAPTVFSQAGTYELQVPAGVTTLKAVLVGSGGGGGGGTHPDMPLHKGSSAGGGGGGGAATITCTVDVSPRKLGGKFLDITVAAGGLSGNGQLNHKDGGTWAGPESGGFGEVSSVKRRAMSTEIRAAGGDAGRGSKDSGQGGAGGTTQRPGGDTSSCSGGRPTIALGNAGRSGEDSPGADASGAGGIGGSPAPSHEIAEHCPGSGRGGGGGGGGRHSQDGARGHSGCVILYFS
ncbi:hypothetical protein ABZ605_13595 [Streptomyces sp. NPDC012765]|uniref:glycine-rich domain-containing protein n=1 Tax=Streptomyces sp. NPDC012765 TaxID=3155249 RepID=UPI0033F45BD1